MVEFNYDVLSITSMAYMAILGVFGVSLNAFAIRKALIVSCHLWKIVLIYQFDKFPRSSTTIMLSQTNINYRPRKPNKT